MHARHRLVEICCSVLRCFVGPSTHFLHRRIYWGSRQALHNIGYLKRYSFLPGHSCYNNNNNNNKHDNVYGAVIMAEPLREFTRFI